MHCTNYTFPSLVGYIGYHANSNSFIRFTRGFDLHTFVVRLSFFFFFDGLFTTAEGTQALDGCLYTVQSEPGEAVDRVSRKTKKDSLFIIFPNDFVN